MKRYLLLLLLSLTALHCKKAEKECEKKCVNGYCIKSDCECYVNWEGEYCDQYTGKLIGTGGGTNLMFWVDDNTQGLTIEVVLGPGNLARDHITLTYPSEPSCGRSGCANFSVQPGTYQYGAYGAVQKSGTVTVPSSGCKKIKL